MQPKIRISLSVINFKERALKTWGLKEWEGIEDPTEHVLFFGMYTMHDYNAWWYSDIKERSIFWCGSDILNTLKDIEFKRRLKLYPETKHYCETEIEAENLRSIGIEPIITQSFLGDVNGFDITYKQSDTPHIWMCAHPGREKEYGLDKIIEIAPKFPDYTFHVYGILEWNEVEKPLNVICHGEVTDEELNEDIKQYQCGFRGNVHEGFSEVPVKSILNGQYTITKMKFPEMWNFQDSKELEEHLKSLKEQKDYNKKGHDYWSKNLNAFPWVN